MLKAIGRHVALFVAVSLSGLTMAEAHPHVWTTVEADVVMDGRVIKEIRYRWTFDEAFSAFASQGLDVNEDGKLTREELQPLAQVNVESLSEYDYFTDLYPRGGKEKEYASFGDPKDYWLSITGNQLMLHFTLPVTSKVDAAREMMLTVYDPSFFVDFTLAEKKPAKLVHAQQGCSVRIKQAGSLDDDTMAQLAVIPADQRDIPPELMEMTSTLSNEVMVKCD